MDTKLIFDVVVGMILPFVANTFDSKLPSHPLVKYIVILMMCGATGFIIAAANGQLDVQNVFGGLVTIATISQAAYVAFLKPVRN